MKKPGRPSYREKDLPLLVLMAGYWRAGTRNFSARLLSRLAVGLTTFKEIQSSQPTRTGEKAKQYKKEMEAYTERKMRSIAGSRNAESVAKRLERQFLEYEASGIAMPVSIYLIHHEERYSVLARQEGPVVGPFSVERLQDAGFSKADRQALENIGKQLNMCTNEVEAQSRKGLKILQNCLPNEYSPKRI
jgi:hypothetical protein